MSDKSVDGNTAHASTGGEASPAGPTSTSHTGSKTNVGETAPVKSEPEGTATGADSTATGTRTEDSADNVNANSENAFAAPGYSNYPVSGSVPGGPNASHIPGQDKSYNYYPPSGNYNGYKKNHQYQGQAQGNKHQNQHQNHQNQHQNHQNQHGAPSGQLSPGNGANAATAGATPGGPSAGASGSANASPANNRIRRPYKANNFQPNYNYYPPQGMYSYGGYVPGPYGGYPVMPNMPIPSYGVPIQNPYAPIPGSKVKLTTKDGKPVDLEEKKKKTAANTPTSSPALNIVSPVSTHAAVSEKPAAPAVAPAVTAPAPNSAAEEFKRKILEKAAASKKAGDDQKAKEKAEKEKSEKEKAEQERLEKVKAQEEKDKAAAEKAKAEQEAKDKIQAEKAQAEKEEREKAEQEKALADKADEEQKAKSDAAEAQAAAEKLEKEAEAAIAGTEASALTAAAAVVSEGAEDEAISTEDVPEAGSPVAVSTEEHPESADSSVTEENEAETPAEDEEAEPSFTISSFLSKVKEAQEIEDIFEVKYPEDIVSADSTKKFPSKKYRYDPQFLIQFRSILQFPIDAEFKAQLEKVDIQTAKKGGASAGGQRSMSKFGNSLPGRFNGQVPGRGPSFNDPRQNSRSGSKRRGGGGGGSSRDKSTRKSNQSKRGGREYREDEQQAPQKPLEDVKPLEKSENRWVPRSRAKKVEVRYAEDGTEILEEEDVERKVKSLLNKLTLEMFTQISDDVLKIADQSKWEKDSKTIRQVISLTFAKACDEPYWSEMYAKFCAKLCTDIPNEVTDETITLPDGSHPFGGSLARRILLTTCQTEYEKGWTDKLPTNEDGSPIEPEMMSDEYYTMAAAKRRGLGLVKFIGHLYNLGMLNDQVIFVCLRDQCKNTVDPSEDSLENLAQLVKTVGPKLDTDDRRKAILKIVFESIQKILDNVKLSSRIMFMLMDLQDLRNKKWKSDKSEAGPKTIEEIHRDAEIKRMEEARASNDRRQKRHHDQGRSNSSRSNSNWNSGLNSNNNSNSNSGSGGYLSNLKKSPSFANQNNHFSNSNNESNLNRESSKRSESTQVNRFAALGADDDNHE